VIKNLTREVGTTLSSHLTFMLANFIINEKLIVTIIKGNFIECSPKLINLSSFPAIN